MAASATALGQNSQPAQTGKPVVSVEMVPHSQTAVTATPTVIDMYCSGYITTDRVSESRFIVGGQNSFDQSRFAGATDRVFIHGTGMKEGDRLQIVRRVKDPDHYEAFKGQRAGVARAGQPYQEGGIVRVTHVERNVAVAIPELNCGDLVPGDLAIPFVERETPTFKNVKEDRYTPSTGKTTGKIIMAPDFDLLVGAKHKVYLSIGADKGLKVGDYLRVTRSYEDKYKDPESGLSAKAAIYDDTQDKAPKLPRGDYKELPRLTLGDMIVLHVHPRSATAMVVNAYEDMRVGDSVELMDVSAAPPISAAPAAVAPAAGENAAGAATTATPATGAATAPPSIACTASPSTVRAGDSVSIACDVASSDNRPVTVRFSSNAGRVTGGSNNRATLDTSEAGPGPVNVRATAMDDRDMSASAVTTVNVEAAPVAPPTVSKVNDLEFPPNSARVDNRAKAMLDDLALRLQRDPNSTVVLNGTAESNETPRLATQRAQNAMGYLTQAKGIDSKRILTKSGAQHGRTVEVWSVPAGATMPQQ